MLIETRELTLSNVDLGSLNEFSAMVLFGDAYLHRLALDTGVPPTEMTDVAGNTLYPGFFWTKLNVPPPRRLEQHKLWETVSVGVDIRGFGGMLLDSTYILGRPGEVAEQRDAWDLDRLPSMHAGSMFVIEDSRDEEVKPAIPKEGMVAQLPKTQRPPPTVQQFNEVQRQGSMDPTFSGTIRTREPIDYALTPFRDLCPGHGVMFATFAQILNLLESQLLSLHAFPPFPSALLDCLTLMEREMCYLGNCHQPGMLRGNVKAALSECSATLYEDSEDLSASGVLTTVAELYDMRTGRLLIASRAKRALAIPSWQKTLLREAERMLSTHGG